MHFFQMSILLLFQNITNVDKKYGLLKNDFDEHVNIVEKKNVKQSYFYQFSFS